MEYTKDLILNVRYGEEVPKRICFKTKNRSGRLVQKIKKHKIVVTGMAIAISFITIDSILVVNFIKILEQI